MLRNKPIPSWALILMLLCSAAPLYAASPDANLAKVDPAWILSKIARPGAIVTPFVELHSSALLKTPLRLQGHYARDVDATLVREVTAPYHEKITLKGDQASVERDGKPARTFSLSHAPELVELQRGFGALLSGNAGQLQQQYSLTATGSHQSWRLELDPKEALRAASPASGIFLYGRGAELRCIETTSSNGELQRTLLAGAARAATGVNDSAALTSLCRGRNG